MILVVCLVAMIVLIDLYAEINHVPSDNYFETNYGYWEGEND